ncbi:MAG: hypothetical protein U5K75_10385 [Ahrensia sp.]|nr:hypothetical protein [Ahrensia sp.]
MSKLKTFTRRTFLIGSTAIAGGVAFGAYHYKTPYPNPLLNDLNDGETTFTPYVKIDQNGITLITPRTDVGQGAYSIQAALIAEELDVELDQINVDPGMPDKAYYNTAFSEEGAPFRTTDESYLAESARTVVDSVIKMLGVQVTGGSTSVPDAYEKLRYAGASARETLKLAAAQKSGIDVSNLTTANGAVTLPDGSSLSYVKSRAAGGEIDVSGRCGVARSLDVAAYRQTDEALRYRGKVHGNPTLWHRFRAGWHAVRHCQNKPP